MRELLNAYAEYVNIINSYKKAVNIDWSNVGNRLTTLRSKVCLMKVRSSHKTGFIVWTKTNLVKEIDAELVRIKIKL